MPLTGNPEEFCFPEIIKKNILKKVTPVLNIKIMN